MKTGNRDQGRGTEGLGKRHKLPGAEEISDGLIIAVRDWRHHRVDLEVPLRRPWLRGRRRF